MDLFIVQKASLERDPARDDGEERLLPDPRQGHRHRPVQDLGLQRRPVDGARPQRRLLARPSRSSTRSSGASSRTPPSALIAFEAGEVDYTYVTADEVERAATITSGTVLPGPSGVNLDIVLNPLKNKDFADKRVRQAFLYAIDRKSILQNIYNIPEPTPPELHLSTIRPSIRRTSRTYDYDPEKAKALLAEAGVDPASWGELDFDTYYGDQGSLDAMTAIQANLADVGIKVKIQQMDSASWSKKYYDDGASTMSMIGGDGGGAAGGYGHGNLHSANAWPEGRQRLEGLPLREPRARRRSRGGPRRVRPRQARPAPAGSLPDPGAKSSRTSTCGRRPGTGSSTTGSPTSSAPPARAWATTTRQPRPGTSGRCSE